MSKHIHRTAIFTIHNPTRHIRAVLDHALDLYAVAYTAILHHFATYTLEEFCAMATKGIDDNGQPIRDAKHLAQVLFNHDIPGITSVLAPLESSLRESLKAHVAGNILGYIELSLMPDQSPSYPSRLRPFDVEPIRQEALDELKWLADDKEQEDSLFAQLQRTRQAETVGLSFCRIDTDRNCGLFYNPDTQKFYARLYVVSPHSRHAKPLSIAGRYIDVRSGTVYMRDEDAKLQESVESFGKGKGSIMVLLEMGKWHEQALRFTETAFLPQRIGEENAAKPVSAHLVKRGDDYQLHVAFRFPKPERVKPQTLLGVDRGINCLAAGAVVSLDTKQVLETFVTDGTELRTLQRNREQVTRIKQQKGQVTKGDRKRARIADQHVHLCANQIVELAIKHQSQIVMEELKAFAAPHKRPKGQVRSNFNKMLPRRQYQKLQDVINAKLTLVGLPPIRLVGAAFTSITCSHCGHISNESRSKEDRTQFVCVNCIHNEHADIQAGVNIARKLPWLVLRGKEKQAGIDDAHRTPWATFIKDMLAYQVNSEVKIV